MTENRIGAEEVVGIFDALAQATRLEAYRLLLRYLPYGLHAGDIARLLAVPHNTLSTHIAHLERVGLVLSRREGRSIIYAANSSKLGHVLTAMLDDLGASLPDTGRPIIPIVETAFPQKRPLTVSRRVFNVLFLCTGNSARSILAEAILNREGEGRFRAYSGGSRPTESPDPLALELLSSLGYDISEFHSKSWKEFKRAASPQMDYIITLCDDICDQVSGPWPRNVLQVHWGISDPAKVEGTVVQKRAAFMEAYRHLSARLTAFVNLPFESLDRRRLKSRLADIATMEGATDLAIGNAA